IQILDTLVLSIELPPDIVAAINRQTEQYYMIQEYKFRVAREAEESKRKQIEADGIAAFQKTVSQGISESYLRWRGIEATVMLAQSPNAKIVVIGTGKDGLPIILGNTDMPMAPATPQQSGAPASALPPPAPATNAPPNASTSPAAPPPSKPTPGTSGAAAPTNPEETANASSSGAPAPAQSTAPPASAIDIPGVRSILSGISGALRTGAELTSPEPQPKH
ncbi:MAG TPA: hypothetical protein VEK31_03720, partial [Xanthobacteraceae bacterium]|nr:hypothetical protein [Xanthobacteraceae bacterium]